MAGLLVLHSSVLNLVPEYLFLVTLKVTLILVLTYCLTRVLVRRSAAIRHFIWCLAIISAVALPFLSLALPGWRTPLFVSLLPLSRTSVSQPDRLPDNQPFIYATPDALSREETEGNGSGVHASAGSAAVRWFTVGILIYAIGALAVFGRWLIAIVTIRGIVRSAQDMSDRKWLAISNEVAAQFRLSTRFKILSSDRVPLPLTYGFFNPVVLLPSGTEQWSNSRRRAVLVHELAHIKRKDFLMQMIAQVACALHWFNPLIWLVASQLRLDAEHACDDVVIDRHGKASDYAEDLLDLAYSYSTPGDYRPGLALIGRTNLERRLISILDQRMSRRPVTRAQAISVQLFLICGLIPLAVVQPGVKSSELVRNEATQIPEPQPNSYLAANSENNTANGEHDRATKNATHREREPTQGRNLETISIQANLDSRVLANPTEKAPRARQIQFNNPIQRTVQFNNPVERKVVFNNPVERTVVNYNPVQRKVVFNNPVERTVVNYNPVQRTVVYHNPMPRTLQKESTSQRLSK